MNEFVDLVTIPDFPLPDPANYRDSIIDSIMQEEKEQWQASLPSHTDAWLLETFEKSEIAELCIAKLNELIPQLKQSQWEYKTALVPIEVLSGEFNRCFAKCFLDYSPLGRERELLRGQIKSLLRLYQAATYKPEDKPKNRLTDEQIERARMVPIESLYQGRLRRVGRRFIGLCPIHDEHSPSFTIFTDKNSAHCFGCSAHCNNAIDYILLSEKGITFQEAVGRLTGNIV